MSTVETIVIAIISILALFFIIHMIIRIAKGENPCIFCKNCGEEDEEKSSCCTTRKNETSCDSCDVQNKETKKE
ncbi:MAG: hypothetical protein KOO69_00320 [Victivallales bacterium]|nr:hypothetical protein [Victivallales bacterium]